MSMSRRRVICIRASRRCPGVDRRRGIRSGMSGMRRRGGIMPVDIKVFTKATVRFDFKERGAGVFTA